MLSVFDESQVFRIDHYLGKETVQNMLVLRFANALFEPLWNRSYIDYVQITAAEDIGIGSRAGYYDTSGALRDLIQNHMLQLLTLLCMEPPASLDRRPGARREGQGAARDHAAVAGRRRRRWRCARSTRRDASAARRCRATSRRRACPTSSTTETYAAVKLKVDNWRWAGVPFYLRTGKRLARKTTEIAVTLKPVPHLAFQQEGSLGVQPNQLILAVQPNEGVSLSLVAKIPGARMARAAGEHGVPLRHVVHVAVARGLRAPDPRHDARRRDAVRPQRRGRGGVGDRATRSSRRGRAQPRPAAAVRGRARPGPAEADALMEPGAHWRPL